MGLYKNMKATVRSPDGNTDFFDIVTRVFLGDTLAPYFFYILLRLRTTKVNRSNKRKRFHIFKKQEADDILQFLRQTQSTQ